MNEYLEQVGEKLRSGTVSAQVMVLLYRAVEEAERSGDVGALEQSLALAEQVASSADASLRAEADRLIELCEQSLEKTRRPAPAEGSPAVCPGCGRPLADSVVRCRACGELLV